GKPSLFQCVRPAPGPELHVCRRHPSLCEFVHPTRAAEGLRRWQAIPRLHLRRECGPGQHPWSESPATRRRIRERRGRGAATLLATRLDHERFETLLVAGVESPYEGSMLALRGEHEGLDLRRVAPLGREISPMDDLRALGQVIAIARQFRPDIVHTHLAKAG